MEIVQFAGWIFLASIAFKFLSFLWLVFRGYLLPALGFVKDLNMYGEWAVVTGATGGIGKQYALQLAAKGFNIVLISRTLDKLQAVAEKIENEYTVKTKILVHDFSTSDTNAYVKIAKEIEPLDIGILVNNVGMVAHGKGELPNYCERSINEIIDTIHTNVFSDIHMTHIVLKGMVARGRGLIVHVTAGAVYMDNFPVPVYAAAKVFLTKLITSLKNEYPGVIEHQALVPFGVATNIAGEGSMDTHVGLFVLSAEDYVCRAIGTLGLLDYSHGCIAHEIQGFVCQLLPTALVSAIVRKFLIKVLKKLS